MIREIAGRQNHSVKLARKLQKKKHRRERGLFVAEGLDLLRIAVEAGADVREVLVRADFSASCRGALVERAEAGAIEIGICTEELWPCASSLGGAADVVFMCAEPGMGLADLDLGGGIIALPQEVGDPGNVGTSGPLRAWLSALQG